MKVEKHINEIFDRHFPKELVTENDDTFIQPDLSKVLYQCISPTEEKTPEQYFINHSQYYANIVCSTYPIINNAKFGKPIADATMMMVFKDLVIMTMADGCGMGQRPATSAKCACEAFTEFIVDKIKKEKTIGGILRMMNRAMAYSQQAILETAQDGADAGMTTFQAIVVVRPDPVMYAVCYVNVGDCRGIIVSDGNHKISELVKNYAIRSDVKSTGGRLGPCDADLPDLGNYTIGIQYCTKGTSIILMTDGVCDNFDQSLFIENPEELGLKGKEWSDEDQTHIQKRKQIFYDDFGVLYLEPSVLSLCMNVYDFIIERTQEQRTIKANSDGKKVSKDEKYHGKMDHSTLAICILNDALFEEDKVEELELEIPNDMKV